MEFSDPVNEVLCTSSSACMLMHFSDADQMLEIVGGKKKSLYSEQATMCAGETFNSSGKTGISTAARPGLMGFFFFLRLVLH